VFVKIVVANWVKKSNSVILENCYMANPFLRL